MVVVVIGMYPKFVQGLYENMTVDLLIRNPDILLPVFLEHRGGVDVCFRRLLFRLSFVLLTALTDPDVGAQTLVAGHSDSFAFVTVRLAFQ